MTKHCTICKTGTFITAEESHQELCGTCLKYSGMKAAEQNQARTVVLRLMRFAASEHPAAWKGITIEDAYPSVCKTLDRSLRAVIELLGPAAGSVFKGKNWRFTGDRRQATKNRRNHARELKVWKLAKGGEVV